MAAGVARPEYSETVQKVVDYLEKHYSDAALSLKGLAANCRFYEPGLDAEPPVPAA